MESLIVEKNNTNPFKTLAIVVIVLPVLVLFALLVTELVQGFYSKSSKNVLPQVSSSSTDTPPSLFSEVLEPIYSRPLKIYAETTTGKDTPISTTTVTATTHKKLFDLQIVEVGVATDGSMETPKNWMEAGWYDKSAKAGEKGNVFINAHYDNNYGGPAAFWSLKNLNEDDKVFLIDEYGKTHTYVVFKVFYVDINDPARLDVLKSGDGERILTLITCGGVWLPGSGTYSKRLVVQANYLE